MAGSRPQKSLGQGNVAGNEGEFDEGCFVDATAEEVTAPAIFAESGEGETTCYLARLPDDLYVGSHSSCESEIRSG